MSAKADLHTLINLIIATDLYSPRDNLLPPFRKEIEVEVEQVLDITLMAEGAFGPLNTIGRIERS